MSMNTRRRLATSIALIALVATIPAAAQGPDKVSPVDGEPNPRNIDGPMATLSQGPNAANGLFSDDTCGLCGTGQQSIAENFVVDTGGVGYSIQELVFWGGYFPTDTANATDALTVRFLDDSGGAPGSNVLCSDGPSSPMRAQTGVILFNVNEWVYTLTLAAPCVLADGTYWVEIFNSTAGNPGGDDWFWETGNLDPTHGILNNSFAVEVPGSTWMPGNPVSDMAIQLNGGVVPVELQSFDVE